MTGLIHLRAAGHGIPQRIDWPLRAAVAASLVVSAVVHLLLWLDGFDSIPWIGPLFMVNVAAGFALAVAVLVWRHWLPLLGAVGFGLATLVAFTLSATVGLLGVHETWTGTYQVTAAVAELVSVVGGVLALVGSAEPIASAADRGPVAGRGLLAGRGRCPVVAGAGLV